jgi:GTPase KRas protein
MDEAEGFMLVYSVVDKKSFDRVQTLQKKIVQLKEKVKVVPVILVANKIDLKDKRTVSKEEGENLAKQYGCQYIETSAKTRMNVDEAFEALAMEVRKFKQTVQTGGPTKSGQKGKDGNCEIQ